MVAWRTFIVPPSPSPALLTVHVVPSSSVSVIGLLPE